MRILIKIISFLCFIVPFVSSYSQLRDTSLYTLYSQPFFYNVLRGADGAVFTGTSEGIFRMDGPRFVKVDGRVGYITLDRQGGLAIDSNGIKYHNQKSFIDLLPFPSEVRDEFHAGKDEFFYITAGGRMHVYIIRPFGYQYRNHSVRTISRNFVGTYSGIYYRGKKLGGSFPRFTDGYIREINGKVFICYSTLLVAPLNVGDSLNTTVQDIKLSGFNFDYISDIAYSKRYNRYFVATKSELGSMDLELTSAKTLYSIPDKKEEVVLLGEDRSEIIFASGRKLMKFLPSTQEISSYVSLPEQIMDGQLDNRNFFLLCPNGLYVYRSDGKLEKLIDLNKAHTLLRVNSAELAISTDAGLFLYNTQSRKISPLIANVEFNRRGLYMEDDRLYAGSINGLYILNGKDLEALAEIASRRLGQTGLPKYVIPLFVALGLVALVLAILLYRSRRRLQQMDEEKMAADAPEVTREEVERFIRENLALASLKSISEKFGTNNANIYTLLAPEKPGAFINRLRMEQVQKMRADRRSAREIAEQTGFSESYVRKVWNQG